jgi:hypothetical protein
VRPISLSGSGWPLGRYHNSCSARLVKSACQWSRSRTKMAYCGPPVAACYFNYALRRMCGNGGTPIINGRIVAILVGVLITFTLQGGLNAGWYVSVPAGLGGYIVARFIGWAINKRTRHNRAKERDRFVK